MTLVSLPLELFHRIFDYSDTRTILLVRQVCRTFYAAVNTYNRIHLTIDDKSKVYLKFLARCISLDSIVSITFQNIHDQRYYWYSAPRFKDALIHLFQSCFDGHQFTRLRSLAVKQTYDTNMDFLLQHLNIHSLESFSIDLGETKVENTIVCINALLAQNYLRRLTFNRAELILNQILYPVHCKLNQLTINICTYQQYMIVLDNLPNLKIFTIGLLTVNQYETCCSLVHASSMSSLKSLIINDCPLPIEYIDLLLTRTSELIRLKLISCKRARLDSIFDGHHWEEFIRHRLPQLNRFEYDFSFADKTNDCIGMLNSLIASFQTPFWLNEKRWFTTCGYTFESEMFELHTTSLNTGKRNDLIKFEKLAENNIYRLVGEPRHGYGKKV